MKNSVEVSKELSVTVRTVLNRASRLGFKKSNTLWFFTNAQIKKIKEYQPIRQFQSKFYFSDDGYYLIINSRINKYEKLLK